MKALKVKDLYDLMRREINAGRGDFTIMVTDDDEANGYHYLWYGPQTVAQAEEPFEICDGCMTHIDIHTSDNVAPHDKHIIIG